MGLPLVSAPTLPAWAEQLAGILPLAALIEFIDVAAKLHVTELSARVCLWNWPVTPSGARLLFSNEDPTHGACLDRVEHSTTLHCMDGRHGDWYPCSAPTTTRQWIRTTAIDRHIDNSCPRMKDDRSRKQCLEIIYLSKIHDGKSTRPRSLRDFIGRPYTRYTFISVLGWTIWSGGVAASLLSRLYIALAYLLCMPLTGLLVCKAHGAQSRRLLDDRDSLITRLVVSCDSLNGSRWYGLLGTNNIINSLLNKPHYQTGPKASGKSRKTLKAMLAFLVGTQWALAVFACSTQGWDAFIISFWIGLCALASTYGYPLEACVRDWLRHDCHVQSRRIVAEVSSRRSLLTALVCLNPDSREGRTSWMDPVLAPADDRRAWEKALLTYLNTGNAEEGDMEQYWWPLIEEGVMVAEQIRKFLQIKDNDA